MRLILMFAALALCSGQTPENRSCNTIDENGKLTDRKCPLSSSNQNNSLNLGKVYVTDGSEPFSVQTKWGFTIDGQSITLTGEQLAQAVREAAKKPAEDYCEAWLSMKEGQSCVDSQGTWTLRKLNGATHWVLNSLPGDDTIMPMPKNQSQANNFLDCMALSIVWGRGSPDPSWGWWLDSIKKRLGCAASIK